MPDIRNLCHVDRRIFLGGLLSTALHGAAGAMHRPLAPAAVAQPPHQLLSRTFDPLSTELLGYADWKPLPRVGEAEWKQVPSDLAAAIDARATTTNATAWDIMLATEELEYRRNGNRSRFEAITFARRNRLSDLTLAECIQNQGRYLDQIANGIWLICEESSWSIPASLTAQKAGSGLADVSDPTVDLFAAETAASLAWIVYLLGPQLTKLSPLLVQRIRSETRNRILNPYLTRNDFFWMGLKGGPHKLNNWNPWINSNVLLSSLLLFEDTKVRAAVVEKACRSIDEYLADYSPDAGCEEGPGYWNRSAGSMYDACWVLVSAHGGKGNAVLTNPFVRAMGEFVANVHVNGNFYLNYGDANPHSGPTPDLAYRFGRDTGSALLEQFGAFDAARRGTASAETVKREAGSANRPDVASLWRDLSRTLTAREIAAAPRQDALPRDVWYPDLALMAARQKAGDNAGFYLAVQAASNGRSHGHNDSGSFIVFLDGDPVFIDVGPEAYTAKTFNKERYTLWTMQSAFHNLPTIRGVMQHEGLPYRASDVQYKTSDARAEFQADLAGAYQPTAEVNHWIRTLQLDREKRSVSIRERFSLARASDIFLTFMTTKEPEISNESVVIGRARMAFDASQLVASKERIDITDNNLREAWNNSIFRLELRTLRPVSNGDWSFSLTVS